MTMATSGEVKIIGLWASSYCVRIEVALKLKGISYEYIDEDLSNKSPLLLQLNPIHKKVPVLLHNGKTIAESLIILEYIDETWPDLPALLPKDPYERALLRFWANFFDSKLSGSGRTIFITEGEEQEKEVAVLKENLNVLENGLKKDFGDKKSFCNGETPGYLEVVMGPSFFWLKILEDVSRAKLIDHKNTPFLFSWLTEFCEFGVAKDALPDQAKLVAFAKKRREMLMESSKHHSYCVRVEVALKLKGISYEYLEEDLITKSPVLLQFNPIHRKIPVLLHKGKSLAESLIILEYIDETWPDSPLMPTDPHERARLRFWASFFDTKMSGSGKTIFFVEGEEQEKEVAALKEFLNILENGLKKDFGSKKPFFNGESPGYLEVVIGSTIGWFKLLEDKTGAKLIDQETTPFLFSWITDFSEFGVVKEALPDQAKLLDFAKKRREMLLESSKHQ
ncbi:glutathione S-transferase U10 [Amborella trichopoda]|uniref:glutathione S-transferase U10 n=1 Tax=Amborella trichopoda TaxID=13333 RepID=UPI0009BDD3ED|nr:glutathione S-transferase U10 [Amborella trichopoda]|eukprot:XP_020528179.1 glutathione S-transferase U10 [Amborella trichopoda]